MKSLLTTLTRYFNRGWHYRWYTIGFAWLACLIGWVAVFQIPYRYEASARLYVDSDAVLTPLLKGLALDNTPVGQLEILQRTLLSRPNLRKLISKTDLEQQLVTSADEEWLIAALANEIKLTPQTKNIFTISYRDTSPKLAYDVVQTVLSTFIESRTGNTRSDMDNAKQFLGEQLAAYEKQLRLAEQKRAEFHTKYMDLLPGPDGGISRFEAAKNQVRAMEGALQDLMARRETMAHELENTPPMLTIETGTGPMAQTKDAGPRAPARPVVNTRLAQAEQRLADLRLKYTDQHPDVIAAKQAVEMIKASPPDPTEAEPAMASPGTAGASREAALAAAAAAAGSNPADMARIAQAAVAASRSRSASNPVYEQLRVKLVDADAAIESVRRQILTATEERDRLGEIARNAPGLEAQYTDLNRDYDVLRKNYTEMLARREEMRIAAAADEEANKIKIQIVDPPQMPQTPVSPNRSLYCSGVFALGLLGGLGVLFLLVQLDQSFRALDDLRDFGYPVIGGVALLEAAVAGHRRMLASGAVIAALVLLTLIYSGLVMQLAGVIGPT